MSLNETAQLHITPMKPQTEIKINIDTDIINVEGEPVEPQVKTYYRGGAILQMRPNFTHLNTMKDDSEDQEDDEKNDSKEKEKEEFTSIKPKFQKRESEWALNNKKKIATYQNLFNSDEPFVPLSHHQLNVCFQISFHSQYIKYDHPT